MNIMTPAEIMDTAFEVLRKNIKTIILYGIGFGITAFILFVLLVIIMTALMPGVFIQETGGFSIFIMGVWMFLFFSSFFSLYFTFGVGIIKVSAQDILDYKVYAHQLIKSSWKSVFRVFRLIISIIILSIPVIAAVGGVFYVLYPAFEELAYFIESASGGEQAAAVILSLILGLIIILVLLAYFTIFCFVLQAAFIEKKGAVASIKRSFELVKANFKKTYGFFILFTITPGAINFSLQGVVTLFAGVVFLVLKLLNMQVNYFSFMTSVYTYSRLPLNIIGWLVISPLSYIMMTIFYFNQRYKLEGYDIILKLKRLKDNPEGEEVK